MRLSYICRTNLKNGLYVPQVQVSWPVQAGLAIDHYELYADGSTTPAATLTTNFWSAVGLQRSTAYSFAVCLRDYRWPAFAHFPRDKCHYLVRLQLERYSLRMDDRQLRCRFLALAQR